MGAAESSAAGWKAAGRVDRLGSEPSGRPAVRMPGCEGTPMLLLPSTILLAGFELFILGTPFYFLETVLEPPSYLLWQVLTFLGL
jgi:hypothetical protein